MTDKAFLESLRKRAGILFQFRTFDGTTVVITMNKQERARLDRLAMKHMTTCSSLLRGYKIMQRREPVGPGTRKLNQLKREIKTFVQELKQRKKTPAPKHLVLEPKSKFVVRDVIGQPLGEVKKKGARR